MTCRPVLGLVLCMLGRARAQPTVGYAYNVTSRLAWGAVDWVGEWVGLVDLCPFTDDFARAAKDAVRAKIHCQDRCAPATCLTLCDLEICRAMSLL
jgi:hypothetical protein